MRIMYACTNDDCPSRGIPVGIARDEEPVCRRCGWLMTGED